MPPKPSKRLPGGRNAVTIAIGFRFDRGAVFCADTQFTGAMVLHDSKIHSKIYGSLAKSVFTIVGNVAYARMAVRQCESEIEKLVNPTLAEMEAVIEKQLLDIHRTHVFPHPDRGMDGGPDFWLLIGLWSPLDGLGTYYTNQTAVAPFDVYSCAGSGEYLGRYLIKPKCQGPSHTLREIIVMACTALIEIKSYDPHCGGNSQFILLDDEGWLGQMHQYKVSLTETFARKFDQTSNLLFSGLYEDMDDSKKVDEYFTFFKGQILNAATKHKRDKEAYDKLAEALSKPSTSQK